jgi:hypothetical protein
MFSEMGKLETVASLNENFIRFSKDLNQIAKLEGIKAAANWEDIVQNGSLTRYISDTFLQIGIAHSTILNFDRGRNTTIQPSLYEIFLGKLIKSLLETKMKDQGVEVSLDTYMRLNGRKFYPDVIIKKENNPIGIIELKHILKKDAYKNAERKRRADFLSQFPSLKTYSIILYAIYDKSALASIVEDGADWIYIIRYEERAQDYRNRINVPFVHRTNPVELALNEVIRGNDNGMARLHSC